MTAEQVRPESSALFLFPDPLTKPSLISAACFLYFHDRPFITTIPPQVVSRESFRLIESATERNPPWLGNLFRLIEMWRGQNQGFSLTQKLLQPILPKNSKSVWVTYPAGIEAISGIESTLKSSGLSDDILAGIMTQECAAAEVVRHIFLEQYAALGENVEALYEYCDKALQPDSLVRLLVNCYYLRLPFAVELSESATGILLTNPRLPLLLEKLPRKETEGDNSDNSSRDTIAWEIFRHVLSPRLDPLSETTVEQVQRILTKCQPQLSSFRDKCHQLSEELDSETPLTELPGKVESLIRKRLEKDIAEILELDTRNLQKFLDDIFSDKLLWSDTAALIGSLLNDQSKLSLGTLIAGLCFVGAKGAKAAQERRRDLQRSPYSLVYSIARATRTQ